MVLTGVLVPIAASALTTYPTTSPGSVQVVPAGAGYTFSTSRFPSTLTSPSVQWFRGAAAIPVAQGGAGSTYTPTLLDQDQQLKVAYPFTVPGCSPTTRVSAAYDFNIQWYRNGAVIGGASGLTYHADFYDRVNTGFSDEIGVVTP